MRLKDRDVLPAGRLRPARQGPVGDQHRPCRDAPDVRPPADLNPQMADVPQSGVFTSNTSSRSTHWLALAVVSRPIWQVPFVTASPPTVTCFQSFDEAHVR